MAKGFSIVILFCASVFLYTPCSFAQDTEIQPASSTQSAVEEDPVENEANPGSQEVEYSEDNYRRFMELKDQNLQKSSLPTNKYQSGTQKLDELPESSQKHLRNQLREVIVQEGAWAPGDENKEYPYVPSEAAQSSAGLRQQEAEAWQELVGEYHEREAQIHANAVRSDAAGAAARQGNPAGGSAAVRSGSGGSGGNDGANEGSQGAGEQGRQTRQDQQGSRDGNEGGYSPGAAAQQGNPNAGSTAGVSENAMEFLMRNGALTADQGSNTAGTPAGNNASGEMAEKNGSAAQGEMTEQSGSKAPAMTAQTAQDSSSGQDAAAGSTAMATTKSQAMQEETRSQSTAGSTQNAMEYLTGSENQDNADATTSASPMDPDSEFEVLSKGTFPIKDLSNVKGVSSSAQDKIETKEKEKRDDGP